jgi:hypothetical protein
MQLARVQVKNFRLLEGVELSLERVTTVIVGRNNSGKTSLTELFRRLLSGSEPGFSLEDFSLGVDNQFWDAFQRNCEGREENEIREILPVIEAKLTLTYQSTDSDLAPLSEFIVGLNPDSTQAIIVIRYELGDGKIEALFEDIPTSGASGAAILQADLFRALRERVPKFYRATLKAVNPDDPTDERSVDWSKLKTLVQTGFINAHRGLDDTSPQSKEVLSVILRDLVKSAGQEFADQADRQLVKKLEIAVEGIQRGIDGDFKSELSNLLPTLKMFGYPGLVDPGLCTETVLNVYRLLTDHTKVRYTGVTGVTLPESYNGLGVRNLIYILLRTLQFFKDFKARPASRGLQLIFIEEPEVHLHPQMQEVFIKQLENIVQLFVGQFNEGNPWPVQFVVSTHSSHIANAALNSLTRHGTKTRAGQGLVRRSLLLQDHPRTTVKRPRDKFADVNFFARFEEKSYCGFLARGDGFLPAASSRRRRGASAPRQREGRTWTRGNKHRSNSHGI